MVLRHSLGRRYCECLGWPRLLQLEAGNWYLVSEADKNVTWTILRLVATMEYFDGCFVRTVFATAWK